MLIKLKLNEIGAQKLSLANRGSHYPSLLLWSYRRPLITPYMNIVMNKIFLIGSMLLISYISDIKSQGMSMSDSTHECSLSQWIYSDFVNDSFEIKIFLPDKYDEGRPDKYPVIYMTDGDRYFGLVSDFVYSILHREGIDVIVVGIGYGSKSMNNSKRDRDYKTNLDEGTEKGSAVFRKFIREELFQIVESKYHIDKTDRALLGWSLGGAFTLSTMFKETLMFKNYLVLSGRLNYEEDPILRLEMEYAENNKDLKARLFYSMGNEDERFERFPEFIRQIKNRRYESLIVEHVKLEGKGHDIIALGEGLGVGLQCIYVPKDIGETLLEVINTRGVKAAIEIYHKVKSENNGEYNFREEALNVLGYHLIDQNRLEESIEIFKLNALEYPLSYNVYDSLGESYFLSKNYEKALLNYEKSLKLNPENKNAEKVIKEINSKK